MTILHNILGDLLYSFLGSPILVFLEHVLQVAVLHIEVRRVAENLLLDMEGGHLEHVLKKYINRAPEE